MIFKFEFNPRWKHGMNSNDKIVLRFYSDSLVNHFWQPWYFTCGCFFMNNTFFGSFIDDGYCGPQMCWSSFGGFSLGRLINSLHSMLYPGFYRFIAQPFRFGLFCTFKCGFMICQLFNTPLKLLNMYNVIYNKILNIIITKLKCRNLLDFLLFVKKKLWENFLKTLSLLVLQP